MKNLNDQSIKLKQSDIDSVISLFSSGELKKSLEQACTLIKDYPCLLYTSPSPRD